MSSALQDTTAASAALRDESHRLRELSSDVRDRCDRLSARANVLMRAGEAIELELLALPSD